MRRMPIDWALHPWALPAPCVLPCGALRCCLSWRTFAILSAPVRTFARRHKALAPEKIPSKPAPSIPDVLGAERKRSMQVVQASRLFASPGALWRLPRVEEATGLKKSTIYELMRAGKFPKSVRLSSRMVAWPEAAVLQWVQDRITGAQQ